MNFDSLDDEIKHLILINKKLKKSVNKKFRLETLQAKLIYANALYEQINQNLREYEDSLTSSELTFLAKAARNAISEIRFILERKLEDFNNQYKMALPVAAAAVFDIKQATALIQPYDGTHSGLDTFIDSVKLLNELTADALKPMAIKFIKTRLSGKARLCLPDNICTKYRPTNRNNQYKV